MPKDFRLFLAEAETALRLTRNDEAAALCEQALLVNPADVEARTLLGRVCFSQGRYAEAVSTLDAVLRKHPESAEALHWLSMSFRKSGSLKAAAGVAMRAVHLHPEDARALNNLGLCQRELVMLPEAGASFRRASEVCPELPEYAVNLGNVLFMQGLHEESADAFFRAIAGDGNSAEAFVGLGRARLALDQFEGALECAERAVEIDRGLCSAHVLLAQLLVKVSESTRAQRHAEKALELEPDNSLAHAILGQVLQSQGRLELSERHFLRSIEIDPRQGYSYLAMVYGRRVSEEDRALERRMLDLLKAPQLPQSDIQSLNYALGRVYEGFGEYEKLIHHYDEANRAAHRVKFMGQPFDYARHAASRERAISFFTRRRFDELRGAGRESELPIFILGMMRSGTTLMEHILSRHPGVAAAGELSFWTEKGPVAFDPATGTLDRARLGELADDYLALLKRVDPAALRITDKMPDNTLMLGFIHAALPNARIIHMRRNPADTCFSIWTTPNDVRFDFGHDKKAIAFAYRTHLKLIEHWRAVLPADRLLDVDYEDLVADQEVVTRRVLAFCDLDWSDQCLTPEGNERAVATPSAWQVRQPVYKTSVRRWKNFEPWLAEFADIS